MDDYSTHYWGRMSIRHARRCAPDMKVLGKVLTDLCKTLGRGRHWPGLSSLPLLRRQCREEFSANLSHSGARCLFVLEGPSHLHWALPDALGTLHYHMGNPTIPQHMDRNYAQLTACVLVAQFTSTCKGGCSVLVMAMKNQRSAIKKNSMG